MLPVPRNRKGTMWLIDLFPFRPQTSQFGGRILILILTNERTDNLFLDNIHTHTQNQYSNSSLAPKKIDDQIMCILMASVVGFVFEGNREH